MAKKNGKQISSTRDQQLSRLAEYGKAASAGSTIRGTLLKFTKGEYLAGQDDNEIPLGTKVALNIDSLLAGWTRWENNRPAEQDMGVIIEGFQPKKRTDLGFLDETKWEVNERDNTPRDPWQFSNQCIMKGIGKGGETYTFFAGSKSAFKSIGRFCSKVVELIREEGHDDEAPIVALQRDFWKSPTFGKVWFPVFEIVGWTKTSIFDDITPASTPKKGKSDTRSLVYED